MTLKFMHDWTHSLNKDKVTNQKLHKHNGKNFFNETFLMKGLALPFNVFEIFTMFTV